MCKGSGRERVCLEREREKERGGECTEREMESVCREREGVSFEIETDGVCGDKERVCGEIKRGSVRGKRLRDRVCVYE